MIAVEQRLKHWAAAFAVLEPARAAWVPQQLVPLAKLTERELAEARATHLAIEMLSPNLRATLVRSYVMQMPEHRQAMQQGLHVGVIERWLRDARKGLQMAISGRAPARFGADPWELTP